jgi:diguanylate cyclase (GGDEF)-like protein
VARSVAFIVSRFGRLQRAGRLLRRQTVRDDRDSVTNQLAGLLAETYHEILGEGTLEAALERIADTISRLIPVDGVSVVSELNGTKDLLFERGSLARDAGDVCQIEIGMVTRGRQKGVLTVWRDSRRKPFDDDDVRLIRWFADAAALALDNARARTVLERQAQTDSLTSLLNHRAFHERLRAELESVRGGVGAVALLLLDIDDFKRINDVHGHGVGDHVLARLAGILRAAARPQDHVCRIGGEEFAVILPASGAGAAMTLAQTIAGELAVHDFEPVGRVTMSAGIAEAPNNASSARELAVCADVAMMAAKSRGKHQIVAYDAAATMRPVRSGKSRREEDLRSIAHLKMLQSLAGKLNRLNDVALIGKAIVDELRTLIDYHACRVYVDDGNLLVPVALRGEHEVYEDESVDSLIVEFGEGITGAAAARREPLLIHDADRCEFAVQIPGTEPIDESMVAVPLLYGARSIGVIVISKLGLNQFDESDVRLLEVLAGHASVAIENARLLETVRRKAAGLEEDFFSTVEALANALEARDAETSSHARAITDLALAVGAELAFDKSRLKRLELGALMHDIGKIGIPSEILGKQGPLTPEEYQIVQQHPELGERILAPIARLADVREIVRHCHEHWDGRGYPDGLAGDEIPLESRIILVVDAYHAMTTDRPYRARLDEDEARGRLREGAGTQFDPDIVDTFLGFLERAESRRALVA